MINIINLITSLDNKHDEIPRVNDKFIHVSALAKFCARRHKLSLNQDEPIISSFFTNSATKIMFHVGRSLEVYFRENFLKIYPITKVLGFWRLNGQEPDNPDMLITTYGNKKLDPEDYMEFRLGKETDTLDNFREIEVIDKSNRVIGHIDWVYLDKNGKLTVLDTKTKSKDKFDELKKRNAPCWEYCIQVCAYIRMLSRDKRIKAMGLTVNKEAKLFYMCREIRNKNNIPDKQEKGSKVYMELTVKYGRYKEDLLELLAEAKKAIKEKELPAREKCKTLNCSSAKECPYVARCFNV